MTSMFIHRLRWLTAAFLSASLLGFIGWLHLWRPAPDAMRTETYPFPTSRHCGRCHGEIYDEWRRSFHARAWNDSWVRRLSNGFDNVDCLPCHAPRPVLMEGYGSAPETRSDNRKEGVTCLSCHGLKRCVAVARRAADAPCRPMADPRLNAAALCQTCHNIHGTVDDWRAGQMAAQGRDCMDCHMPLQTARNGRTRRRHTWPGGHDARMVGRAVDVAARIDGGRLLVTVANTGAGHNTPTELRHRSLDVEVALQTTWFRTHRQRYCFRNPYKNEGGPNTQLRSGEKRQLWFDLPATRGQAHIQLVYRLMPVGLDRHGTVIRELTLPIDALQTDSKGTTP